MNVVLTVLYSFVIILRTYKEKNDVLWKSPQLNEIIYYHHQLSDIESLCCMKMPLIFLKPKKVKFELAAHRSESVQKQKLIEWKTYDLIG